MKYPKGWKRPFEDKIPLPRPSGGPTMLARIGVTRGIEPEGSSASLILFEKTRIGARAGSRGTCDGHLRRRRPERDAQDCKGASYQLVNV
jgi:hypothetical protein